MAAGTMEAAKKRIEDLITNGRQLRARAQDRDGWTSHGRPVLTIDRLEHSSWKTSCHQALERLCGPTHHYVKSFVQETESLFDSDMDAALGILAAVVSDIDAGQFGDIPTMVRAEVFADFLEQAEYLLEQGFYLPAAVLAGAVLEDTLRKLCAKANITLPAEPKIEWMNAELMKAGVYEKLTNKQVTAWADVRHKAAHGWPDKFTATDVHAMLRDVQSFVAARMT